MRLAVEQHAMTRATRYLEEQGFTDVEDVSRSSSWDLTCRLQDVEVHIEVKGTTTDGSHVNLTRNEVRHARDAGIRAGLFVLSHIELRRDAGQVHATGGSTHFRYPWVPTDTDLSALTYQYRVEK